MSIPNDTTKTMDSAWIVRALADKSKPVLVDFTELRLMASIRKVTK